MPPSIFVGTANRTVLVRVEGKGSFLNSGGLKEFAKEMVNRGYREFVINLKCCSVMDSTFMGTMAGIALRLREIGQGQLRVVELNDRNRDLLANLGLDQLFTIDGVSAGGAGAPPAIPAAAPVLKEKALDNGSADKVVRAQTMLEAHEAVVEANPENAAKFKDVLEYLKHDLQLPK